MFSNDLVIRNEQDDRHNQGGVAAGLLARVAMGCSRSAGIFAVECDEQRSFSDRIVIRNEQESRHSQGGDEYPSWTRVAMGFSRRTAAAATRF